MPISRWPQFLQTTLTILKQKMKSKGNVLVKNHDILTRAFDVHSQCFLWLNKKTQSSEVFFVCFEVLRKKLKSVFPTSKVEKEEDEKVNPAKKKALYFHKL